MLVMKKIISILVILSVILSLCGCTLSKTELSVGISAPVKSLDPVRSQNEGERIVTANCFEGLVRFNEDNNIHLANATGYSVDKTGKIYTFSLNPEAEFHISASAEETLKELGLKEFNSSITAEDYIYGIKRYLTYGDGKLTGIAGADKFKDIEKDEISGVKALDEHTLEITLTNPDPDFLFKLCTLPVYPCSKTFVEKLGEDYATTPGTLLSNGPFYVESTQELQTVIKSCSDYNGLTRTKNTTVTLYTTGKEESYLDRFKNGSYDIYLGDSTDNSLLGFSYIPHSTTVWGIGFNGSSPIGKSPTMRAILFKTLDVEGLALPDFATAKADRIVPNSYILKEYVYGENAEKLQLKADKKNAQAKLKKHLENQKKDKFSLTFAYPVELKAQGDKILENWNIFLAPQLEITAVQYEIGKAEQFFAEGNFDVAIMPVAAENPTALSLLESFKEAPVSYENDKLYSTLYKRYSFDSDLIKAYENAEEAIVEQSVFYPLFYSGKMLYTGDGVTGIFCADSGKLIYFHNAEKTEKSKETTTKNQVTETQKAAENEN